jgi:hypothetical protein
LREKLIYIAIIIAVALSCIAISYYFMSLLTPSKYTTYTTISTPVATVTYIPKPTTQITAETQATTTIVTTITTTIATILTPVPATFTTPIAKPRVGYAEPLKIVVFSIIESRYVNIYRDSESLCLKASPGMKFIVIGIRIENAGSKDISSDELSQYIADIVLLTSSGLEYKLTRTFQSPFLSSASQEECLRNNAVSISWPRYFVLRPGDYIEFPAPFIIPESDIPVKLQIIKDSTVVTEIDLR